MTSQQRNRCPQCNTGFFQARSEYQGLGSGFRDRLSEYQDSLLARCQYCNYQRDSIKCPNCREGYLERLLPAGSGYMPSEVINRLLTDPKHTRCGFCGYGNDRTRCPNCNRGSLRWQIANGGEGRVIASQGDSTDGSTLSRGYRFVESKRCSTCGYVDPSSIPGFLGKHKVFLMVAAIVLAVVVLVVVLVGWILVSIWRAIEDFV